MSGSLALIQTSQSLVRALQLLLVVDVEHYLSPGCLDSEPASRRLVREASR